MIPQELSPDSILKVYDLIKPYINITPLIKASDDFDNLFNTKLYFKCEFLQNSGSFKSRGAINNILSIKKDKLKNGITTVSAGNHAIAASYAANLFNIKNKIFLYKSANKFRVQTCKNLNANIIFTDPKLAFQNVKSAEDQGYTFVHPFDGVYTLQGTSTLGCEIFNQIKDIDNVVISIGGGGLISGVGAFLKQLNPKCKIIGIEPEGASGMTESIKNDYAVKNVIIDSIADSLCTPLHMPYSFSVAKQVIDEIVIVKDAEMINSMKFAAEHLKLFLEPACVAGIAALAGSLKGRLLNQKTLVILCGSNIDIDSWHSLINKK